MRILLSLISLMIAGFLFAQDVKTIQTVNQLIGPRFHFQINDKEHEAFYVEEKDGEKKSYL